MITKPVTVCGNTATLQIGGRVKPDRHGECEPPCNKPRVIRVRGSYRGYEFLDTLIHELTHLAGWHIDEEFIRQFASDLAEILLEPEIEERIYGH